MKRTLPKLFAGQLVTALLFCSASLSQVSSSPAANAQPGALSALAADHATLSVQDLDREADWYERVLGFKTTSTMQRPTLTGKKLQNANYRIDLIKYPGSTRLPADPVYLHQGWVRIALNVLNLPAALAALKAANTDVKASGDDGKGGPVLLSLHDPEGNEIEIFDTHIPH